MLYQVMREVISPATQNVVVDAGEVLTAEALQCLNDVLGIDNIDCKIWLTWAPEQYPTEILHKPRVCADDISDRCAMDLTGFD